MNKKAKIFIAILFSIMLIPVLIIGITNYTKEQELNKKIENSKETKTLSLNNITSSITCDELFEIETSKEYTIKEDISVDNENMQTITFTNTSFYGSRCEIDYVFYNNKLGMCIFTIDTSRWQPKNIYEELVKINSIPDTTEIDDGSFYLETHTWYGKNGTIVYNNLNNDTIEILYEIFN